MDFEKYLQQGLKVPGLPVHGADIPYILQTLSTVKKAEAALKEFPSLKEELPITIVDKRRLTND